MTGMEQPFPSGPNSMTNIDTSRNLKNRVVAFLVAGFTLCFGPLMPAFQAGKYSAKHINLIWDTVYGIGFSIMGLIFDYHAIRPPLAIVGFVVWPLLVFGAISYSTCVVLKRNALFGVKAFTLLVFVISLALNVTVGWRFEHFNWLPSFQKYSDVTF